MLRILAISLVILFWTLPAQAIIVVTPPGNAATEGNANNTFPFFQDSMRYQQLYDASLFGGVSGIIDKLSFRFDRIVGGGLRGPFNITLQIRLSHTSVTPATMSATFASNIGTDNTLVLDASVTVFGSTDPDPHPFDITFDLDDLFTYNGADNLLVDIKKFPSGQIFAIDAVSSGPGSTLMNRAFGDLNAASGSTGTTNIRGLVTAFDITTTVAEPSTMLQVLVGLAGLAAIGWRRKQKHAA